jgi:hypothetical protein
MELDKHNISYEQVIDNPPIPEKDYPIIYYNHEEYNYLDMRKKIRQIVLEKEIINGEKKI